MDDLDRVRAWVDARGDDLATLVERLVEVPTENPPGRALGRCAAVLVEAMAALDLAPETIPLAPARALEEPCIVRGHAGDGRAAVCFHGHLDVVPAQDPGQLVPRRGGGRIVGRGAADMKGGLASMLYGAAAARDLGLLGDGRIVIHLVPDEETGSVTGSGHLRAAGLIDPSLRAMLTPEPTGGAIWHASRGALTLRVSLRGRTAHVGQAHLGVNAFAHLVHVAAPLLELARELEGRRTRFALPDDAARGSMLVVGGEAASGASFNVVPGSAWFSVDRRFNPEESLEEELARLTGTIEAAAREVGADVAIDVLQEQPSASTDPEHPAVRALVGIATRVEGRPPAVELCPGVLETRWYAQLGIPAVAYGPGRLEVSHGPEEDVAEQALRRCAVVYGLAASELLAAAPA